MNIIACLVHEAPECVADLVANLRFLDPDSGVLLYDGSKAGRLLCGLGLDNRDGVFIHPTPRRMNWGWLHDYAIDCMRFALDNLDFTTLTFIDSDQLAVRPGYSTYLADFLQAHPAAGCLVMEPRVQPPTFQFSLVPQAAWREVELWRPFLRRFPGGEAKFPYWTLWSSTVFTREAANDLVNLWPDPELQAIMSRTSLWAPEELVLPTLVALAGHELARNPCSYDYVLFRKDLSVAQLDVAMSRPDVHWAHPFPRRYDDPLRAYVRERFGGYVSSAKASTGRLGGMSARVPLVSCVMPTCDRRVWVPQAIQYFMRQDYPERELIVIDDGSDPVADLIPDDPRVRYIRLSQRRTIGAKRNIGNEHARGKIVVHWDDDDWMADRRLSYQVRTLLDQDVDICGLRTLLFWDVAQQRSWRYEYPHDQRPWVADATFCYRRDFWAAAPFPDASWGLDTGYLWQGQNPRIGVLPDPSFYVALVHPGNTSTKHVNPWWHPNPAGEIVALLGDDWAFYEAMCRKQGMGRGMGPVSNLGKWDLWFRGITQPRPFGDTRTYELGAQFLADCTGIEDWGCGAGWFKTYLSSTQRYRGIDGSATPFADEIVDLRQYRSHVEAVFMRHVLEHNYAWRAILDGAVASCTRKMVLVLFTPLGPRLREIGFSKECGVPELSLPEPEVLSALASCSVQRLDLRTATQYGAETIFFVERPSTGQV